MRSLSLEERVNNLEREFAEFKSQPAHGRRKDWRRTIGIFTGNQDMKDLFAEAMKLRESDRRKASRRPSHRSAKP